MTQTPFTTFDPVTVTPSYQILVGTVAFMMLPVLVASMGGPIGDRGRMTVVHIPLAMALMGLAVWLSLRARAVHR